MQTLIEHLESRAPVLARRAVEWMSRDPLWVARYGEVRARRFADEDARFHVEYLIQALRSNSPTLFPDYARWLQTVLTTRGMATFHLEQHLQGLADAIKTEHLEDPEPALAHLRSALTAVIYPAGPARPLLLGRAALVNGALERLQAGDAAWARAWGGRPRAARQLKLILSYLADAIALRRPELFEENLAWLGDFVISQGVPRRSVSDALSALDGSLRALAPEDREAALEVFRLAVPFRRGPGRSAPAARLGSAHQQPL